MKRGEDVTCPVCLEELVEAFPVLVGKNRVYNRGGCWLVFTSQEIGHLLSPHSGGPGTPLIRLRRCHFLTPYGWSAG